MGTYWVLQPELPRHIANLLPEFSIHPYAILAQAEQGHCLGLIHCESHALAECGHEVWLDFHYLQTCGRGYYREIMPEMLEADCKICQETVYVPHRQYDVLLHNGEERELDVVRTATLLYAIEDYWAGAQRENLWRWSIRPALDNGTKDGQGNGQPSQAHGRDPPFT